MATAETTRWRKKPVEVDAAMFGAYTDALPGGGLNRWLREGGAQFSPRQQDPGPFYLEISTREGIMRADVGDWIIRGVAGEFYPCKPDIFEATYEAADAPPASGEGRAPRAAIDELVSQGERLAQAERSVDTLRAQLTVLATFADAVLLQERERSGVDGWDEEDDRTTLDALARRVTDTMGQVGDDDEVWCSVLRAASVAAVAGIDNEALRAAPPEWKTAVGAAYGASPSPDMTLGEADAMLRAALPHLAPASPVEGDGARPVPHIEYARVKQHLYDRIERITARAERAEAELLRLVDLHHRTIRGSRLHDPGQIDWPDCPCKTCRAVVDLLPEQAEDALARCQAERAGSSPAVAREALAPAPSVSVETAAVALGLATPEEIRERFRVADEAKFEADEQRLAAMHPPAPVADDGETGAGR